MFFDLVFFFKQKSAYEMLISDWSSDVCSSDLLIVPVALSLLLSLLLIQLFGYFRLIADPQAAPVAIPIIKDAAEHARDEIEDVLHEDARPAVDDRNGNGTGRR